MRKRRSATWNANRPATAARRAAISQACAERAARMADPADVARAAEVAAAGARIDAMHAAPLARGTQGFSLFKC